MANFLVDHEYTLDITPSARPQLVPVSEYDVGRIFTFTLKHNDEEMTIPSSYGAVTVEGTIGSYAFSEPASIENGKIVFQLTESMTAHAGKAWTKIKFANADAPISTCAFFLVVDRAGVEADTVIGAPGFQEQIEDAVDAWLDDHDPIFTLPEGGQSGQALLSDGTDGAVWGEAGIPSAVKTALLNVVAHIGAWSDDNGQVYYNALEAALNGSTPTPILPSAYQQVEYIENPNGTYMVTNIAVPLGFKVHGKVFLSAKPSSAINVCGGFNSAVRLNISFCCFSGITTNSAGTFYGSANCFATLADLYESPLEFTTVHTASNISIGLKNSGGENTNTVSVVSAEVPALNVFRASYDAPNPFTGRIYLLEVLDTNNQATAKLIPCYRKADNVVGMYDIIGNAFYTSANSTVFTKGGDVA